MPDGNKIQYSNKRQVSPHVLFTPTDPYMVVALPGGYLLPPARKMKIHTTSPVVCESSERENLQYFDSIYSAKYPESRYIPP